MDIIIALIVWTWFTYWCGKSRGRKQMRPALDAFDDVPRTLPGRVENIYAWHSHDEQIRQLRAVIIEQQRQLQSRGVHENVDLKPLTADEGRQYMPTKLQLHSSEGLRVLVEWTDNGGAFYDVRYTSTSSAHAHHAPDGWQSALELDSFSGGGNAASFVLPCAGEWLIAVRGESPSRKTITQWSNTMRVHVFDTVALHAVDTPHGRVIDRQRVDATQVTAEPIRAGAITASRPQLYPTPDDRHDINNMAMECGEVPPYLNAITDKDVAEMDDDELKALIQHLAFVLNQRRCHTPENCVACGTGIAHDSVVKPYDLTQHGWKEE
jgi:hypothetical protein